MRKARSPFAALIEVILCIAVAATIVLLAAALCSLLANLTVGCWLWA